MVRGIKHKSIVSPINGSPKTPFIYGCGGSFRQLGLARRFESIQFDAEIFKLIGPFSFPGSFWGENAPTVCHRERAEVSCACVYFFFQKLNLSAMNWE